VDLNRYVGKWYEIARFPNWFQKGVTGCTASYSLGQRGTLWSGPEKVDGLLLSQAAKASVIERS